MITRLLLVATMMVAVGAAIVSSTGAFFSDTETSTGNTFTAGDIDLQIDNESYVTDVNGVLVLSPATSWSLADLEAGVQKFFNFSDLKPGDVGEDTISIHVGSNNAWMCAAARITADLDNSITEPEDEAGGPALSDGTADGDLDSAVNFIFWRDDGDNVLEGDEAANVFLQGPLSALGAQGQIRLADSSGSIFGDNTPIPGDTTFYIGKAWCFGALGVAAHAQDQLGKTGTNGPLNRGTGVSCSGAGVGNIAQTDSVVGDMQFYAVQSRNNSNFTCAEGYTPIWPATGTTLVIHQNDLATIISEIVNDPTKWFFYNDTNDTVMTIDQFAGSGGQNHMELVAGSVGAKMVLDSGVDPRYNIATSKYGNLALSSITSLKYRVYDSTVDADLPFFHFNVDFTGSNSFQGRLVYVPTGLAANTWTTVDMIQGGAGMWLYSGATWPAPIGDAGTIPHSWSDILTAYPLVETLAGGPFLGVRVGEPGPAGATGYVDWIELNGTTNDFEL